MPHPIYGPPQHRMTELAIKLWLPTKENGRKTTLQAFGISETSRGSLWSLREEWSASDVQPGGYEPTDALHHLAMVAMQDQPTTQAQVEACLVGEGWKQLELDL